MMHSIHKPITKKDSCLLLESEHLAAIPNPKISIFMFGKLVLEYNCTPSTTSGKHFGRFQMSRSTRASRARLTSNSASTEIRIHTYIHTHSARLLEWWLLWIDVLSLSEALKPYLKQPPSSSEADHAVNDDNDGWRCSVLGARLIDRKYWFLLTCVHAMCMHTRRCLGRAHVLSCCTFSSKQ
jgi:hypothetical protein